MTIKSILRTAFKIINTSYQDYLIPFPKEKFVNRNIPLLPCFPFTHYCVYKWNTIRNIDNETEQFCVL